MPKPASKQRHYLPASYPNAPDRPVYFEDIGTHLTIAGLVLQGMGGTLILMLPGTDYPRPDHELLTVSQPTLTEWGDIIRQSDDPEVFVGDGGGLAKTLHRKSRYSISGEMQQRVWVRDGCECIFCGAKMGKTLLTVDHWIPLELGGANDETNYVTACRRCNKAKGALAPEEFCRLRGYDYARLQAYVDSLKG